MRRNIHYKPSKSASILSGVIVMRFKEEGDSVISMALTEHEESEE